MKRDKEGLKGLSALKRLILVALKRDGSLTIAQLAKQGKVTSEAVRQQVSELAAEGWVTREAPRRGIGRPVSPYRLAAAAEELFPKAYDELAVGLLDAAAETLGPAAVRKILATMADERVKRLKPMLQGKTLEQRLELLRDVYKKDDPYMSVEAGGELRLVETNCPFYGVASRRPMLCSLTVSVLSRLLGRAVKREKRFQRGDGRCVFRVLDDRVSADASFQLEPES